MAPVPRQRSGLEENRERVPSAKKKAPAKRGEGWYPECGLKESESTTIPCHTDLQIAKFLLWNSLRFTLLGAPRFHLTVPNLPAWPARYRIATLTLICCGTM